MLQNNKINMRSQTQEGMDNYYLEKMLSDSAQFRAYNELHQRQVENRRAVEMQERLDKLECLRQKQNPEQLNPVVRAISTWFGTKKSA